LPLPDESAALTLGQVGTAQGVRGWVRVRSYTDPPEALFDHEHWQLCSPRNERREVRVLEATPHQQGFRVKLEGVDDRDAAQALVGWRIEVARSEMPPLAEREHYRDDLLGFEVHNLEGSRLGTVAYFVDLPMGQVMVVKDEAVSGTREHWVPAVPKHVVKIDVAARRISVDWPAELG
jgi:16S rRNA processing protein RimM